MLKQILRDTLRKKGLSSHKAADEIGTSHTTILRALRGDIVDLATIIKIADWLGIRPSELLNSMSKSRLSDQLLTLLAGFPELRSVLEEALISIKNESADPAIIADIVSYASYKLKTGEVSEKKRGKPAKKS